MFVISEGDGFSFACLFASFEWYIKKALFRLEESLFVIGWCW